MSKTTMIILSVGVLLFAFAACAGLGVYIYSTVPNPANPSLAETQLAQMINAALTQTFQFLTDAAPSRPILFPEVRFE